MLRRAFVMSTTGHQDSLSWMITSITVTMSGTTGAIGSSNALYNPNQFRVWAPKVLHTVQVELLNGEIVYRYLLAFESSTMKTVAPFYYQGL